jgi:hypothetical protein
MAARVRIFRRACALLLLALGASPLGACELLTSLDYTDAEANPCPEGLTLCNDGNCFDLKITQQHCGACGHVCQAGATCIGGDCSCMAAGFTL